MSQERLNNIRKEQMLSPKVSIVVPTYNVEKYIKVCVDSLLSQTLQDMEIILVDDGSTDSSGKICDTYAVMDQRIKVIHQNNKGLGLSRNSGLSLATGEYVGFVDSDDYVSKEMFETLYENATKYDADVSYCTYKRFVNEDEVFDESNFNIENIKVWSGEKAIRQYMLERIGLPPQKKQDNLYGASVCCGIFLRERLLELGVQFVSERQFIAEDMLFDIEVIPHCRKIVHCDIPLYYYRYNPKSLTKVYKADRFSKNVELYHEMYRRLLKKYKIAECFNSMSRYLLVTSRIAIIQEAEFVKRNGKRTALKNIKKICNNTEVREILKEYEFNKMPIKYRGTVWLQKKRCCRILLFIYSLYVKIKRYRMYV